MTWDEVKPYLLSKGLKFHRDFVESGLWEVEFRKDLNLFIAVAISERVNGKDIYCVFSYDFSYENIKKYRKFKSLKHAIDFALKHWEKGELPPLMKNMLSNEDIIKRRIRIGEKINRLRIKRNLSLRELSDICGITYQNIQKIENGKYNVGIDILGRIADALGATIEIKEKAAE